MKLASRFIALGALALSGCVAYVDTSALVQPQPGIRLPDNTTVVGGWLAENHTIVTEDGVALYAALFQRPNARGLVVYFGGNQFTVGRHYAAVLQSYASTDLDVLIADHRGYGASGGSASLGSLLDDAVIVHDYARDLREYSGLPVLVHGQSLGSFMAGEVARQRSLDGLVLESSATTAEDWVKGFVDANPFVRRGVVKGGLQGQGNLALMSVLDEPLLIVVGEHDRTTRPAMSQRLFEVARLPPTMKELLVVPDAGHNDASAHPSFAAAIVRLLARGDRGVKLSSRIYPEAASKLQERVGGDPIQRLYDKAILVKGAAVRTKILLLDDAGKPTGKYYYQTHVIVRDDEQISLR